MKDKIEKIFTDLEKTYKITDESHNGIAFRSIEHAKMEQINKKFCIYFFPSLLKAEAKEIFHTEFHYNLNHIISAGVAIVEEREVWFSNFNANEFKRTIKSLDKITPKYLKLIQTAFSTPFNIQNLNPIFDRRDLIEEFYILYRNTKSFLLQKNKITGVPSEKKGEFVDKLLLTILTLWFLQERDFFNRDNRYFINKFLEFEAKGKNFFSFLIQLFQELSASGNKPVVKSKNFGEIVILGPALFLLDEDEIPFSTISISNECFYQEGLTEKAISIEPKRFSDDLPIFNLFESRDWTDGNIDEFVLGAVYEKLINADEKKEKGAYYTPEEITVGMSEMAIYGYLKKEFANHWNRTIKEEETFLSLVKEMNPEELQYTFERVSSLRICDPAVGSAHFLESAIEVMVQIYETIWEKAVSLELSNTFLITTGDEKGNIQTIDILKFDTTKEEERERFRLYIKYFIILSRNIYGVDISPHALKVAKARLFLTMAKHFDLEKNTFVRFPNVHFNLRQGNSLLGHVVLKDPPKSSKKRDVVSHDLFSFVKRDTNKLQKEIDKLPADFFKNVEKLAKAIGFRSKVKKELESLGEILTHSKITTEQFHRAMAIKAELTHLYIISLTTKYAVLLRSILNKVIELFQKKINAHFCEEYKLTGDFKENIAAYSPFHWQLEFPEVFFGEKEKSTGFHIVLGNPPFIQLQKMKEVALLYEKLNYETFAKTGDIYCLFYERMVSILIENGYGFYITSNSWMRTGYGKSLRKMFVEKVNPIILMNFEDKQIFPTAIVEPNLLLLEKTKNQKQLYATNITDEYKPGMSLEYFFNKNKQKLKPDGDKEWNVGDEKTNAIKEKMEKNGILIKDLDVKIYRGITTGLNDAFVIDTKKRDEFIKADPKNKDIIKPLLGGKDLKKYYYKWNDNWIINTHNGLKKESIPAINVKKEFPIVFKHLNKFKKQLEVRLDKGEHWSNLRNCAYLNDFSKEKIVWKKLSSSPMFSFDKNKMMLLNTTHIMVGNNLKYMLIILNSFCIYYFFNLISTTTGMGENEWIPSKVKQLPIPKVPIENPKLQEPLVALVDRILTAKGKDPLADTSIWEAEIDARVFHLYGLTEEEMLVVLDSFPKMSDVEKLKIQNFYRDIKNGLLKV